MVVNMNKILLGVICISISLLSGCSENTKSEVENYESSQTSESNQVNLADDETYFDEAVKLIPTETTDSFDSESYFTDLSMDELIRSPENNLGKKVLLVGDVLQSTNRGKYSVYRIMSNQEGNFVFIAIIESERLATKIIEKDEIRIYGKSLGEFLYISDENKQETAPLIYIDAYEL